MNIDNDAAAKLRQDALEQKSRELIKQLVRAEQSLSPFYADIIYVINILQYVSLTFTTTILLQAKKVSDTKYCLPKMTQNDKNLFNVMAWFMPFSVFAMPLLLITYRTISIMTKRKLLARTGGDVLNKTARSPVLIALYIFLALAIISLLIVYFVIINNVSIVENTEGEGYCLEFGSETDYKYIKIMNWLIWLVVVMTTMLLIYL